MRIRHKVPSIFSISMVDVLCCALGCVILLWLLNAKQVEDDTEERRAETIALLADVAAGRDARDKALKLNDELTAQLRLLQQSEASLKVLLAGEQKLAREQEEKLKAGGIRIVSLEGAVKKTTDALDAAKKSGGEMTVKIVGLEEALKKLKGQLVVAVDAREKETARAADLAKGVAATKKEMAVLSELLRQLRDSKAKVDKALSGKEEDIVALLRDKKTLEKLLAERGTALAAAQKTVIKLTKEQEALRAAAELRFAGIELTGKRVAILVDTSASMEMIDENTEAKGKWKEVAATVGKLLRSLPELEKFQVIGFGPELAWPLGSRGKWIDFDAKTSHARAEAAVLRIQPNGGTNMYIAMQAAFELRRDGLDAVYLLSDGLPNQGEGVPPEKRGTKGMERGMLLAKHIRATLATTWNKPDANKKRVRINTIGFFYESPDLGSFLWALARENDGSFVGMSRP